MIQSILAALFLLASTMAFAAEPATVRELNRGPNPGETFAYDPALVRSPLGGTVRFEPTDKGHNVTSIRTLWPEEVALLAVPFNQGADMVFDRAGVYAVQCTPHVGLGMVALIVVGDADLATFIPRIAAAPGIAPRARARLNELAATAG